MPCVNGQCLLRADGTAVCYCNSQWTGAACDTLISPCVSQPCLNNGVCYSVGLNYTCICRQGYSGSRCEIVLPTLCTLNCANNGTCSIRGQDNKQICICPAGYTGTLCEVPMSPCVPSPCLNNGVCIPSTYPNGTLGFQCICTAPYTGKQYLFYNFFIILKNIHLRPYMCNLYSNSLWKFNLFKWWNLLDKWQSYNLYLLKFIYRNTLRIFDQSM